jgi:hypothetical protein
MAGFPIPLWRDGTRSGHFAFSCLAFLIGREKEAVSAKLLTMPSLWDKQ